jgi:alkylhydroperoxidase family enzyme
MAQLLDEIEWGQAILPRVSDSAWEAEVKRRVGQVSEVDRRVAASPWAREVCVLIVSYRPVAMPQRLFNIGALVTAQENSCRYCYGANRAYMKILGYSESFLRRIEQDATFAELDDKERAFISFCRSLARSRPRPMKADYEALVASGFAPLVVSEMAMLIALGCYYNRIGILIACPPELAFERVANGFVGRLMGPVMRMVMAMRPPAQPPTLDAATLSDGPFGTIVATLAGLPGATIFRTALDGAFASAVLPRSVKALMFAVVARTLGCRISEIEARKLLVAEGFSDDEIDSALLTLRSPRLSQRDARLIPWVRNTVYYQTAMVQQQTATLATEIGDAAILEAIGVAALANATVRLAMLLE